MLRKVAVSSRLLEFYLLQEPYMLHRCLTTMNSQVVCAVPDGGRILRTLSTAGLEVWLPTGLLIVQQ